MIELDRNNKELLKEQKYIEKEKRWYMHITYDIKQLREEINKLKKAGVDILTKDNSGSIRKIMGKLARHIRRSYRWYIKLIKYSRTLERELKLKFDYEYELKVYENSLIKTLSRHGELWDIIKGLNTKTISLSDFKSKIAKIDNEVRGMVTIMDEWEKNLQNFEKQIEKNLESRTTYEHIMNDVEIFNKNMIRDIERGSVEDVKKEFKNILEELLKEIKNAKENVENGDEIIIKQLNDALESVKDMFKKIEALKYPTEEAKEIEKQIKEVEGSLKTLKH